MSQRRSGPRQERLPKKRESLLTSSSSTDQPRARVGRLGRPHGLNGYLGLYVEDADLVHFQPGSQVFIDGSEHTVRAIRRAEKGHHVAFEGINDRSAAEAVRGLDVLAPTRRRLDAGEYWVDDLIGMAVVFGDGRQIGVVIDVINGVAQDRLVIGHEGSSFEVPFVKDLVPIVDLVESRIIVDLPSGLVEEAD